MAIVSLTPGTVSTTVNSSMRIVHAPTNLTDIPGGLYPLKLMIYDVPEYRMQNGWPTDLPPIDFHAETLMSVDGEVLADRLQPYQVTTGAETRWIVDEDYFDPTELSWLPYQNDVPLMLRSSAEYIPTLIEDYSYRVGKEVFVAKALNFDADARQHMWLDTAGVMPFSGYTVILVASLNSAYGNTQDIPYNGIWCHGGPTPEGDTFPEDADAFFNVTYQGNYLYGETEQHMPTRGVPVPLSQSAPVYLALSFGHPMMGLYAASGPSSIRKASCLSGPDQVGLDPGVVLGRSSGDVLHTADMALMDLNLYGRILSDTEIAAEIALLSSVYGGA